MPHSPRRPSVPASLVRSLALDGPGGLLLTVASMASTISVLLLTLAAGAAPVCVAPGCGVAAVLLSVLSLLRAVTGFDSPLCGTHCTRHEDVSVADMNGVEECHLWWHVGQTTIVPLPLAVSAGGESRLPRVGPWWPSPVSLPATAWRAKLLLLSLDCRPYEVCLWMQMKNFLVNHFSNLSAFGGAALLPFAASGIVGCCGMSQPDHPALARHHCGWMLEAA